VDKILKSQERRKQARLERLKVDKPVCLACGFHDWRCFENHHVAGCKYCRLTVLHCKNCHAIASNKQYDHPEILTWIPTREEVIGRLLLGLADFFEQLIKTLREFGAYLIDVAQTQRVEPVEHTPGEGH
jgi:hypothetical protein